MDLLSTRARAQLLGAACLVWVGSGVWLIACFVVAANWRTTTGAMIALGLSSFAVFGIKNAIDMARFEARAGQPPPDPSRDLFAQKAPGS